MPLDPGTKCPCCHPHHGRPHPAHTPPPRWQQADGRHRCSQRWAAAASAQGSSGGGESGKCRQLMTAPRDCGRERMLWHPPLHSCLSPPHAMICAQCRHAGLAAGPAAPVCGLGQGHLHTSAQRGGGAAHGGLLPAAPPSRGTAGGQHWGSEMSAGYMDALLLHAAFSCILPCTPLAMHALHSTLRVPHLCYFAGQLHHSAHAGEPGASGAGACAAHGTWRGEVGAFEAHLGEHGWAGMLREQRHRALLATRHVCLMQPFGFALPPAPCRYCFKMPWWRCGS